MKLITYGVGFGVGLGVPAALGIGFAIGFKDPLFLMFPLPFALALLLAWLYRITGYRVTSAEIMILRRTHPTTVDLGEIAAVRHPAAQPPGNAFGLWRVEGFFGNQGSYWNKSWGRYRVYVTNEDNRVEIQLKDGGRVFLSPGDPRKFATEVSRRLSS